MSGSLCWSNLFFLGVFFRKALNASGRVYKLLFACEKRMAVRANFNVEVADGGPGFKLVAAYARDDGSLICGMNFGFHFFLFRTIPAS